MEGEMEALPLKCSWCKQGETKEHLGACPPRVDQEAAGKTIYCRNTFPFRSLGPRPLEAAFKWLPSQNRKTHLQICCGSRQG